MSAENGKGPTILSLGEIQEKRRKVSREELDTDLTQLSFAILQRQERAEARLAQLERVMRGHAQAIAILDVRSLGGRIRRAKAWIAAWHELARGYAMELGILRPVAVDPFPGMPTMPRPDLDNPDEAAPKS